jgi:DNA-binding response OmpR family regulator
MKSPLRVLVVEDEMIAMLVEDMLQELGHEPVGSAAKLETGIPLANTEKLDLAILDVNLAGVKSSPIADLLVARGIPVIFATGYGAAGLDPEYASFPAIAKPFTAEALANAMKATGASLQRP